LLGCGQIDVVESILTIEEETEGVIATSAATAAGTPAGASTATGTTTTGTNAIGNCRWCRCDVQEGERPLAFRNGHVCRRGCWFVQTDALTSSNHGALVTISQKKQTMCVCVHTDIECAEQ